MARVITVGELRAQLDRELDALAETEEALYVSSRGRLAGVVLDAKHYARMLERLDYLGDSVAAVQARDGREAAVPWVGVRE